MSETETITAEDLATKPYLSVKDLCVWFSCGRTTLHRMRMDKAVKFPEPIKLRSCGRPRWKRQAIEAYARKLEQRR